MTNMKTVAWHIVSLIIKFIKYALILAVLLFLLTLILLAINYQELKNATVNGLAGKTEITTALAAVQSQDWETAFNKTKISQEKFNTALQNLDQIRPRAIVEQVAPIRSQINDLEYLLKTAEILSRSLERTIPLIQELDQIRSGASGGNFANLSTNDKVRFLQLIYESEPELNGLKANLDLAILNLNKIHRLGILWPVYQEISDIKEELKQASDLMKRFIPLTKLLPALSGYPQSSHFLLILQNNDELRPTGGFIGVYGILESSQGEIVSLETSDSYHLDMPAVGKWNLEPPLPLKKYLKVENWYFRDANWSPDWPLAAQQIQTIYQGENRVIGNQITPLTGLIAITPNVVADLLDLVGPITINNETYRSDNFQPLLQYNVEIAYQEKNISSWNRKEIINDLLEELKKRLFSLPTKNWDDLLNIIDQRIKSKDIQIYFNNPDWEDIIDNLEASGKVKKETKDYLLVVDANLAAFKTDAVMQKNINYNLSKDSNKLKSEVKLSYRHEGGFDWRTTRYRSYTRIYVPLGSQLISLHGLNQDNTDISYSDDLELNKTVFGFFLSIEPGSQKEITINYYLPNNIKQLLDENQYELLVQRQAGSRIKKLKINFDLDPLKIIESNLSTDQTFRY